jgi:hypothetical protein
MHNNVIPACENLVGFSTAQPDLFKHHQLLPVRDLKLLVRDYTVSACLPGRVLANALVAH